VYDKNVTKYDKTFEQSGAMPNCQKHLYSRTKEAYEMIDECQFFNVS
jgi:hypothetical protein